MDTERSNGAGGSMDSVDKAELQKKIEAHAAEVLVKTQTMLDDLGLLRGGAGEEAFAKAAGAGQGMLTLAVQIAVHTKMPREGFLSIAARAYDEAQRLSE